MNALLLHALGELADKFKKNDFQVYSKEIVGWVRRTFGMGKRYTFVIHAGEKLNYFEDDRSGELRTMLVGDKSNPYLQINDHGTGLKGLVSVHLSAVLENSQVRLIMEVYPITNEDTPLAGMIWFDDLFTFGNSPTLGSAQVWSVDHIVIPTPHPLVDSTSHMIQGFCFGMVIANTESESVQLVNRLLRVDVMSPVGYSAMPLLDEFFLADTREFRRPDGLSDVRFRIVQFLYQESIAILSKEAVVDRFKRLEAKFNSDEIARFAVIIHRMVADGWFSKVTVRGKKFFVPTPKLLTSI